jgi:hypothetical protein
VSVLIAVIAAIGANAKKPAQRSTPAGNGTTTTTLAVATTSTDSPEKPIVTAAAPNAIAGMVTQDMQLTPGVASAAVTQANIQSTICVSGYTASVRNVSAATKRRVFAEYGIANPPSGAYEVDHLIPLELGGSNDIRNLWPEAYAGADNARDKDTWENRLKSQVCAGTTTLAVAQDEIIHWWVLLGVTVTPAVP